ncbi:PRC-barrel domain-containing protein [Paraburkholderia xenovorans]|uniref:PRC-barrel domain-containing protein n=1 Tax=Paraburkholderia xenovorans TaxID=36873 RepID=UPI0038BD8BBD
MSGPGTSHACQSYRYGPVYNDLNDKIGNIYGVIIAPDRKATYAVVSVGGFPGMGKH